MNKKFFSVHELGKLFNLSNQTLHFYDRKDLLKPHKINNKGYRQYSYNQIYALSKICYLRKIGFTIKQIHSFIHSPNLHTNIQSMEAHSKELILQYEKILEINKTVQRKLQFIKREMEKIDLQDVKIRHFEKRLYLPLGTENNASQEELFYHFPTMAIYSSFTEQEELQLSIGAFIESKKSIPNKMLAETREIKEGEYLSFYHKGPYSKVLDRIYEIQKQYSNLKFENRVISINIIDQFVENDENNFVVYLQIPLAENNTNKVGALKM